MEKTPYVHLYTDALEALPLLARGSNAAVFMAIGILLPKHQNGPKLQDLVTATGLSVRTIQAALSHLIHSGLVTETTDGEFTPNRHIEYRRNTHIVRTAPIDQSFNQSSKIQNQSNPSALTEKDFGLAYSGISDLLLLYQGGIKADEIELFKELFAEFPDPALHARAVKITKERAERPNYKYYARVVRSGAIETLPKQTEVLEVLL